MRQQYHVAIIGGGFSGTALAIHLIRRATPGLRVTLIEERERLGRGLAYSTSVDAHVLNTRADCMSLFSDAPEHFQCWLEAGGARSSDRQFVSRAAYGNYVEDMLIESLARRQNDGVGFTAHVQTRARTVARRKEKLEVELDDGRRLRCDAIVIATGHPPCADPLAAWLASETPRYLRDPWDTQALAQIAADDNVLILGTGLTMVDFALSLQRGNHRGAVQAMSRRGLLPRVHADSAQSLSAELRDELRSAADAGSVRGLLRTVRSAVRRAADEGATWHAVIDALRPITPELWARLTDLERRRFMRLLRPYWEVHRHRLAPASARAIAGLQETGRLTVAAGRVLRAVETADGIELERQLRGEGSPRREHFKWIVNCTGPSFDEHRGLELNDRLIADGLLTLDPLGLGYATAANGLSVGEARTRGRRLRARSRLQGTGLGAHGRARVA